MIRKIVAKIVEYHGTNDPFIIAQNLGINVVYPCLDEAVKGVYISNGDEIIIAINSKFNDRRKKIIMAHELGHYYLHKENNFKLMKGHNLFPQDSLCEIEANKFASELIIQNVDEDIEFIRSLSAHNRKKLIEYKIIKDDDFFYKLCEYLIKVG